MNFVIDMSIILKGVFKFDGRYKYLPTMESLWFAKVIMTDIERYPELGGARGTTNYLLKQENLDKINK